MCDLDLSADIWTYFLLKSSIHLRNGGTIAAILPWSFLQADYAINIRKWISSNFRSVRVLVVSEDLFQGTNKRVLLLWLRDFGRRAKSIELGHAARLKADVEYEQISEEPGARDSLFRNQVTH